jgi:FSR family fosmidomycin resistance protein-like MFS transporter
MKSGIKFKWEKVLDISAAHLLHDIYSAFLAPLYPLLVEKLGLNYFMIGSLTVIQRIASLFNPIIGLLIDRKDLRYIVIITPAITAISMSFIGLAQSFWQLALLLFIMGWSAAFFHVSGPVLIKRFSGNRAGLGMSLYMLGGELARSLGPIIIVSAISWWSLEGTYKLMPAGLLASGLLYFRLRKLKNIQIENKTITIGIRALLAELKGFYLAVTGYTFARGMMKSLLVTFLPAYYVSQGETLWVAAYTLSILQFSGAVGTLVAGNYSDKIGRQKTLIILSVATPLFMVLFLLTSGWMKILSLIFIGLFMFGSSPVLLAMVQEKSEERPNFNNGVFMTISFAFGAIATLLIGFLADVIGLEKSFLFSPLFAALAIPFALRLGEKKN